MKDHKKVKIVHRNSDNLTIEQSVANNSSRTMDELLVDAISKGVTDPEELVKMSGAKTALQVFNSLDRISLRKEYHTALATNGISFDYLVTGIRNLCDTSMDDRVKLKCLELLLKSLGVDKYDIPPESKQGWEDIVLQVSESDKNARDFDASIPRNRVKKDAYEVDVPEIPKEEEEKAKLEEEDARRFYGS